MVLHRIKVGLIAATLLALLACAGCASSAGSEPSSLSFTYGSIDVVADDNYPPYCFRDDQGNLQGIVVDQWALWEKKTGIRVNLTGMSWDKAQAAMRDGRFDVIDTIFINDERLALYDFTRSYAELEVPVFFSSTISGINSENINTLKGFSIAVKRGDASTAYLHAHGITDLQEYDSYEEIIAAVKARKALVFVMDKPPALYLLVKAGLQNEYNYSGPLYTGEFHRAVKKGDVMLLHTVQSGFDDITAAEYHQIDARWFGTTVAYSNILPYAGYTAAGIALVILLMGAWNWLLKGRVRARTAELEDALERLEVSESQNVAIIKAMPQLLFILDAGGEIVSCLSSAGNSNLYMPAEKFLGRFADVFPAEAAARLEGALLALRTSGEMQVVEYEQELGQGVAFFKATLVNCSNGRMLMLLSNITERKRAEQELYEISRFDALTHAYNRMYFEQTIARLDAEGARNIGLVICDLDGLKLVNDTLGHAEGDNRIRRAADVLRSCFAPEDILARIGGDEFAVLVRDATDQGLEQAKARIYGAIERINAAGLRIPLSMSVGYALRGGSGEPLAGLFKIADDYMYRDKLNHMQSTKSKNIELLSRMLKARDFNTEGHADRLQALAGRFARVVGMHRSDEQDIKLLAQFHDIGKIGISDTILFKPGPLTEEERVAMRRHTEIGYRIALSSPDIAHIADWILKHHEGYDGGGYPLGLRGEEIPVQCRMLAIIDAYDAMTHDRPYRAAMSGEAAVAELRRCAGRQFDPALVEVFVSTVLRDGAQGAPVPGN